ncbi:MAG: 5'/3'-nucleotidase SurE [Gammaproteobacteria bacterium TMED119]|nr:MAG: 5'/3'-nucleotidase SurE [Gammaproteobacteria bacterium TMED119]|tara:strand:+ start:1443 stop:2204 length:762 start_codon:yes stop_codon:yes gene_type:complete
MHLLISNDDGYQAPGIQCLAEALAKIATITVVAPHFDRSGASNSLTLQTPIRATEVRPGWYRVDGTPTDCVHLGVTGLLQQEPDMVVSGINAGANLGDDVIYSGTVAAAMEGRHLGAPAIAVSINSFHPQHFATAAHVATHFVQQLIQKPLANDTILNINVPDIPLSALAGVKTTRLGNRHKAEPAIQQQDPRGRPVYWVGAAGPEQDAGPGTDFHAVNNNFVSVTPLHVDLTQYSAMDGINEWLMATELGHE